MHKNVQKVKWNTQRKISCPCQTTHVYSMVKVADLWCFLRIFQLERSPVEGQSPHWAKRKVKEKKEMQRNMYHKASRHRSFSPSNYLNFDFYTCLSKNVKMAILVERKACCQFANAFLSRLEPIWPILSLKISNMSKKCIFDKRLHLQTYHCTCQEIVHLISEFEYSKALSWAVFPITAANTSAFKG